MRRFAVIAAAGLALLAMGYLASGIGQAGTVAISESSSSIISTTTTVTSTTTTTTTTHPAPKVTICHRTKSKKHPYNRIRVSGSALKAHMKHRGDIIPAPAGVCPTHVVLVRNHHIVKPKKKKKHK